MCLSPENNLDREEEADYALEVASVELIAIKIEDINM
jgi:hypothetical protein